MKIIETLQSSFSQYNKRFFWSLVNEQIWRFFIFKTYAASERTNFQYFPFSLKNEQLSEAVNKQIFIILIFPKDYFSDYCRANYFLDR